MEWAKQKHYRCFKNQGNVTTKYDRASPECKTHESQNQGDP